MNNRSAAALAMAIAIFLVLDFTLTGGSNALFLARKFLDLTEYIAFWR